MRPHDTVEPLKIDPRIRYPGAPDRYAANGLVPGGLTPRNERRPQRRECASCMYYDPGRAYCNHIHAPVDILFVCPQALDEYRE